MFKGAKFGIFATSFGATVALLTLFLGKNKYENFVLCAPGIHLLKALSVVSRTEGKTSSMNELKSNGGLSCGFERRVFVPYRFFEESEKLNLAHAYKNKNQTKIHIFQGNQDKVVDPHDVVKFQEVDKKNITIEIIKDAGHQFKAEKSFGRIINKSAKLLSDPQ